MSASLVGSEMCIRDRRVSSRSPLLLVSRRPPSVERRLQEGAVGLVVLPDCLLYTSDAADDML
eukprot:2801271-Alexandrium_andersonii.AAC.1